MDKTTNAASAEGDRLGYNPYRDSKGRFDDGLTLADITGRPFSAKGTNDKKVKKAKKLVQEELDRLGKQLPKFLEDGGPQSIADLARLSGSDRAKVYKKLSDMEAKGKVTSRKQGITRMYTLTPKTKQTEALEKTAGDETVAAVGQKSYIERDLAASARLDLKAAQAREQKDAVAWATEQGLDMPKASASDDEISKWTEDTVTAFRAAKKKAQQDAVAAGQDGSGNGDEKPPVPPIADENPIDSDDPEVRKQAIIANLMGDDKDKTLDELTAERDTLKKYQDGLERYQKIEREASRQEIDGNFDSAQKTRDMAQLIYKELDEDMRNEHGTALAAVQFRVAELESRIESRKALDKAEAKEAKGKPDPKAPEAEDQKASADTSKTIEVGDRVTVKGKYSDANPYGGEWGTVAAVDGDEITVNPAGDTKTGLIFTAKELKLDAKADKAEVTNDTTAFTPNDFKEYVEREYRDQATWTPEELNSIGLYTREDYMEINGHLRDNYEFEYMLSEEERNEIIDNLRSGMKNELKEDTTLFRGLALSGEIGIGDEITDLGFSSTSFNAERAARFAATNGIYGDKKPYVMKINAPVGQKGIIASLTEDNSLRDNEQEYILPDGMTFRVTGMRQVEAGETGPTNTRYTELTVDIVPEEDAPAQEEEAPASNSVEQIIAETSARDKALQTEIDTLKKEFTDITAKGYANLSEEEKSRRWELDKLIDEKRAEQRQGDQNLYASIKALAPITNTATPDAALADEGPTGFESLDDNMLESLGSQLWSTWGQDTAHYEYQGAPGSPRRKMALQVMRELSKRGITGEYSPGIDDNRVPLYIEAHNEEVAIADAYVNLPEAEKAMTPYNRFRLSKKTENAMAKLESAISDDYLYDSDEFFRIPKGVEGDRFFSWKDRAEWLKNNPNQTNAMDDRLFQNATADDNGFWWEIRMQAYHKLEDGMDKDEIVDTVKQAFDTKVANIYHSMSEQDEYYNSLNTGIGPIKLYRYGAIGGRRQANGAFFSPNKIYTETYSDRAMGDSGTLADIDKTAFKEYTIQAEDIRVYRTTNIEDLYEELFNAPLYARKNGYADDQRVKELWRKEKQIHKRLQDEGYDAIHYDYPSLDNGYSKRGRSLGLDRNAAEMVVLSKNILADMKKNGKTVEEYNA